MTVDLECYTLIPIMRIALVQLSPYFGKVEQNIVRAIELITNLKADLFVLPELCFTGYTFRSKDEALTLSEPADQGFSIIRMRELSVKINAAIVYGFPERNDEGVYNSAALILPDGKTYVYRKLHLFMHEKDWFLPGDKLSEVIEFRGARLGIMICFDWIFPEAARTLALDGAQIICHPANLVLPYCQSAMTTRCLENRVFAVTANRVGRETRGDFDFKFTGRSQIVSPRGQMLFKAEEDKEEVGVADIDYRESDNKWVNEKNNLWVDRRPIFYSKIADAAKNS